MSILIKGMKMTKNCDECPLYTCMHNHDNCPLVPVPTHGRLIDADELAVHKFVCAEHDISISDGGACYRRGWNDAIEAIIENAETIIGEE